MNGERGRPAQRYRVLDRMGKVVAEGSTKECAEQLGRNAEYVRRLIRGEQSYPEHWAFPIADSLVQAWDELVTPLREAYGIPRYRPDKEGKR